MGDSVERIFEKQREIPKAGFRPYVWTARDDLGTVAAELEKTFGEAKSINLVWRAQNNIDNREQAAAVVRLSDALEDCDDVSTIFHNFDMTEEAMARLEDDE